MLSPPPTLIRIIICIAIVPWLIVVYSKARSMLHILQLEGYRNIKYLSWAVTHRNELSSRPELIVSISLALAAWIGSYYAQSLGFYLFFILWMCGHTYLIFKRKMPQFKKALAFTPRVTRLLTIFGLVLGCQIIALLSTWFKPYPPTPYLPANELQAGLLSFFSLIVLALITPLNILIAGMLSSPLETTINQVYFKSAQRKIQQLSTIRLVDKTDFQAGSLVKKLLNRKIIIDYDKKPDYVYFSHTIKDENQLRKRIERIDINQVEPVLNIWRQSKLTVIAITGSYGKTSTKYILKCILAHYYPTLMTPESYNTPMGICKVIRGQLTVGHKYFIVEMGARRRGDISELCRLVHPDIGIITSIGPQHLETFGSQDNVIRTKSELIPGLKANGLAVLNYDDQHCRKLAAKIKIPHRGYGTNPDNKPALMAENIKSSNLGVSFTARTARGKQADFSTCLLGRHNVYNVLAAATVALECGLELSQIAEALAEAEPVPHRLQLIKGSGGVTIIDDAYNSNPKGAQAALQVLADMPGGKKMLITPGMVELGVQEYEQNKQFGMAAAAACDIVILVGQKRTKPIAEGLKEAGFPDKNLTVVASLNEATAHLHKIVRSDDVVLFENDLPDNYNE